MYNNKHIKMDEMKKKVAELEEQLTGDMEKDMDIRDEIHKIKMNINGVTPTSLKFECVNCGS